MENQVQNWGFEYWLSIIVIIWSCVAIGAVYAFGRKLSEREFKHWFHEYWDLWFEAKASSYDRKQIIAEFSDVYRTFLQERNDFWEKYGQILVAIVIITVLAVLLITKTISPEAGLPILSAVSGFAIAKSTSISNQNRPGGGPQG